MRVQDGRVLGTSPTVTVPVLFAVKRSHVPANTADLLVRQPSEESHRHDNGLLTMPGEERGVVVLPCFVTGLDVVVGLTQVMEHTDNVGASLGLPFQTQLLGEIHENFRHFVSSQHRPQF